MKSHDNLVSNEDQKNMKKLGDKPLPENVYSLDSDESETLCFSEVHGACGECRVNVKDVSIKFTGFQIFHQN